ncbi:MAG TPA: MBL fold metallo-hydrolase [Patescibacteria group bacterium]|nr:MBL fold metallo-hydrolase [Patescibacteria group bacterium]
MKMTVLGSGGSLGTPAAGGFWGVCDPANEKNHRTRASLLIQSAKTTLLVDTSYDLRQQLTAYNIKHLDGVLISHGHNDHVNGIDDLRAIAYHGNRLLDLYTNAETHAEIERRWPYLYKPIFGSIYTQFLAKKEIGNYDRFTIGDIDIESFEQDHTTCLSLGFRFGNFAYSVDVANLNEKSLEALRGVETWMVDAAAYHKDSVSTHANLKRVIKWVELLKPKMTYLTVLTTHMDYQTLCDELPPHIRPAYDGLEIDLASNHR